jgi:transcriptional regulator GlxA family with amidase domain
MRIGFFVIPGFELLDLSGPLCAFEFAGRETDGAYTMSVASEKGGLIVNSCGFAVESERFTPGSYDTVIVAGGDPDQMCAAGEDALALLRSGAEMSRRAGSVCTGAFLLAATGLLDDRRATTHWRYAARLQALHPKVRVDADKIFIQDGRIWTSAGVTAGIDLALALIEDDLGLELSRSVARNLVVYHRRQGGQSQYSTLLDLDPPSDRIRRALAYAREHLHERLSVERLAEAASLSPRQFSRAFLADTGQTPGRAIDRLRAEAARPRVENGVEPLETIARSVGFADPERMRQSFIRNFGQAPQAVRRGARANGAGEWRKTWD